MVYSNSQFNRNYYTGYGYGPSFGATNQSRNQRNAVSSASAPKNSTSFGGALTESETKALTDCYVSSPSESLPAAAWGGVTFGLMNNPRFVAHPINTFKAFKHVDPMFKDVLKDGSTLNKLWANPETNAALRDAYCEMHRVFARGEWKFQLFRKRYTKDDIGKLKGVMEQALLDVEGKSPEEARKIITTATKTLESAYVTNGPLRFFARPLSRIAGGSASKTVEEGIANSEYITKGTEDALKHSTTSFKNAMKTHAGIGGMVLFAGFEFITGMGNIKKAFEKDRENKENGVKTNYGMKQLGQTTIKGLGSGAGWGIGEAIFNWGYSKWGTKLGTKLHPSVGTISGGVIGLVGASIGMMVLGRITKKLVGEDIGAKLEAQELAQTPEGQVQLLQTVYQKAQKGEASPEAKAALQKVLSQMG